MLRVCRNIPKMSFKVISPKVVIIGSYKRGTKQLEALYEELVLAGCQVLSPRGCEFDGGEFPRLAGEDMISDANIEIYHLSSIVLSDLVWLHCPDGYLGSSGLFELGFAVAHKKVIFSYEDISGEVVLSDFLTKTTSVFQALKSFK